VAIATADATVLAYLGLRSFSTVKQYAFFAWLSAGAAPTDITASPAALVPTSGDVVRVVRNANRTLTAFVNDTQACVSAVLAVPGHQVGASRLTGGRPPSAEWRRRVL
jgi:hypothetical protein